MTNTRITDPEVFERRYPVILDTFKLRDRSGGVGRQSGGDGIIREIRFRREMMLSVLSERRSFRPFGLQGGQPGMPGLNILIREGTEINIGSKISIKVRAGDVFRLLTPGGGGYGEPTDALSRCG